VKDPRQAVPVSRKEGDEVVRYAHIGTGNFNEKPRVFTPTIRC
jgi:polyphosphate kinase